MISFSSVLFANLAVLVEYGEVSQRIQIVGTSTPWLMGLAIIVVSLVLTYGVWSGERLK